MPCQVQEQPALASLRRALEASHAEREAAPPGSGAAHLAPLTSDSSGPTPCLVANVPRECTINPAPTGADDAGVYGREFAKASFERVREATTFHQPSRRANILAIEAPEHSIS
jgi:hypothetical protein